MCKSTESEYTIGKRIYGQRYGESVCKSTESEYTIGKRICGKQFVKFVPIAWLMPAFYSYIRIVNGV